MVLYQNFPAFKTLSGHKAQIYVTQPIWNEKVKGGTVIKLFYCKFIDLFALSGGHWLHYSKHTRAKKGKATNNSEYHVWRTSQNTNQPCEMLHYVLSQLLLGK